MHFAVKLKRNCLLPTIDSNFWTITDKIEIDLYIFSLIHFVEFSVSHYCLQFISLLIDWEIEKGIKYLNLRMGNVLLLYLMF